MLAEPAVLIAIGIGLPVLLPEQEQGHPFVFELLVRHQPVGNAADLGGCQLSRELGAHQTLTADLRAVFN